MTRRKALLAGISGSLLGAQAETVRVEGTIVDSISAIPVEGARVLLVQQVRPGMLVVAPDLWRKEALPPETPGPDAHRMVVQTGPDGRFSFHVARPTRFMLYAYRDGYADMLPGRGGPGLFAVNDGEHPTGLLLKMVPESLVSGRLLDDETRQPVRGLVVRAYVAGDGPGSAVLPRRVPAQSKPADAHGQFSLAGLPAGNYILRAESTESPVIRPARHRESLRDLVLLRHDDLWYPGVSPAIEAETVRIVSGAPTEGLEFRLKRTRSFLIRGKVLGAEGVARVTLLRWGRHPFSPPLEIVTNGEIETNSAFEIEGLGAGQYVLRAEAPGGLSAQATMDIVDHHLDDVELLLQRGVAVRGAFKKPPPEGIKIELRPCDRAPGKLDIPLIVDAEGTFRSEALPYGRYLLAIRGSPSRVVRGSVKYNGIPAPHGLFVLDPSFDTHNLAVELAPATAVLRVKVTKGLRPAAHANVVLVQEPVEATTLREALTEIQAGEDGLAEFSGLPAGNYRLAAFPAEIRWRGLPDVVSVLAGSKALTLNEDELRQVEMSLGLRGRYTQSPNSTPVVALEG